MLISWKVRLGVLSLAPTLGVIVRTVWVQVDQVLREVFSDSEVPNGGLDLGVLVGNRSVVLELSLLELVVLVAVFLVALVVALCLLELVFLLFEQLVLLDHLGVLLRVVPIPPVSLGIVVLH